jgi:lysophospholipid acyltransferase (LPLAT)-like uncharacterized protein
MLKRLLDSPLAQGLIGRILGFYMLACGALTRWTLINRAAPEAVWAEGGAAVICFWHGRIVLAHRGWPRSDGAPLAKVLISHSRDGGIVAAAVRAVGHDAVRGSSAKGDKRKGAIEAMRQMLRHMETGGTVAIAPDGPRGPRMRAQIGPVQLAKRMNAPIICYGWSTKRRTVFRSWDRFVLPHLFSRGVYVWSDAIRVPPNATDAQMEDARALVEAELNRVTALADLLAGAPAIEPAPQAADALALGSGAP